MRKSNNEKAERVEDEKSCEGNERLWGEFGAEEDGCDYGG